MENLSDLLQNAKNMTNSDDGFTNHHSSSGVKVSDLEEEAYSLDRELTALANITELIEQQEGITRENEGLSPIKRDDEDIEISEKEFGL